LLIIALVTGLALIFMKGAKAEVVKTEVVKKE